MRFSIFIITLFLTACPRACTTLANLCCELELYGGEALANSDDCSVIFPPISGMYGAQGVKKLKKSVDFNKVLQVTMLV
ncbi:hypothetical protein AY498_00330 [Corynebacterium ulcerans]|nr:hypothetical protein AY498_00330 [Corynebacterium ulcerans]